MTLSSLFAIISFFLKSGGAFLSYSRRFGFGSTRLPTARRRLKPVLISSDWDLAHNNRKNHHILS